MSPKRPDEPDNKSEGRSSLFPEGWRKAVSAGANALFTSEEGGKGPLGDLRLPKEAVAFLFQQSERGRQDLMRMATREVRRVLRSVDLRRELRKSLLGIKMRVRADITFEEDLPRVRVKTAIVRKTKAHQSTPDAATQSPAKKDALAQPPTAKP
jgi:hypothetical protein